MSDKAAARQYAVRNKKNFNMRHPEYIPEPTGASKHSTSTQHKHKHKQPFIGQSDDKAATSIGKSAETDATSIGKSEEPAATYIYIGKSEEKAATFISAARPPPGIIAHSAFDTTS